MIDLTKITTPFGLLDKETQDALRAHGGPYEWFSCEAGVALWVDDRDPDETFQYAHLAIRVKPQPPKPREWWIVGLLLSDNEAEARDLAMGREIIHVREVL